MWAPGAGLVAGAGAGRPWPVAQGVLGCQQRMTGSRVELPSATRCRGSRCARPSPHRRCRNGYLQTGMRAPSSSFEALSDAPGACRQREGMPHFRSSFVQGNRSFALGASTLGRPRKVIMVMPVCASTPCWHMQTMDPRQCRLAGCQAPDPGE